jgi:hypothetical protein
MLVKAKCLTPAWDNPILYKPGQGPFGGLYEIDSEGKLAKMQIRPGVFVFEFDREAAKSSSAPNESSALSAPSASTAGEGVSSSAVEVQPEPEKVDLRGKGERICKGCGQPFPHVNALVQHKKTCPGKAPAVQEVTQGAEATV